MKKFIPISDELIFNFPEQICGPLVPFSNDYDCYRSLDVTTSENEIDKDISNEFNKNK
jgi:hypothetical protein|tara:strand:- start:484 stop:657 length:174 start_codon:yes stop_codon:yes gene_type:complete